MILDKTRSIEYMQYRQLVLDVYNSAAAAAADYFELDKAVDIDKRLASLEQHYDELVFWRCEEVFDQLPNELVPANSAELDELVTFLSSLNPIQPIKFRLL